MCFGKKKAKPAAGLKVDKKETETNVFKLIVIGDMSVGKTCILTRFTEQLFDENYSATIGVDFKKRDFDVDGKNITLQVWDTAGQERYRQMIRQFYNNSHGVMICYDITKQETLNGVRYWIADAREALGDKIPIVLVGNKLDMASCRQVETTQAKQLAESFSADIELFEISAKSGENVEEAFQHILYKMMGKK